MLGLLLAALAASAEDHAPRALAKLAVATGPVEAKGPSDADYKPLAAGASIEPGTWVRLPAKSKCIFDCTDNTEVRINELSEVLFEDARKVAIKQGQIFARIAQGAPFNIKTEFSPISTAGGIVDVTFRERPPGDPLIRKVSKTVTTVITFEGSTTVGSRRYAQKVTAGWWCTLVDSQLNTPDGIDKPEFMNPWIHEVLLARSPQNPELQARLQNLVGMLGQSRGPQAEPLLRELPEAASPALAKLLKSPPSPIDVERRKVAAKILADVAPKGSASDLAAVLADADADVRVQAARGLERLAGKNLGHDEAYWRGANVEAGRKAWEAWAKDPK